MAAEGEGGGGRGGLEHPQYWQRGGSAPPILTTGSAFN